MGSPSGADRTTGTPAVPWGLHHGDARSLADWLPQVQGSATPFLTATISSPPYGDLKDYGHPKQLGWAQSYDEYLLECRSILSEIFDFTKEDGTLWLVVDSLRMPEDKHGPWHLKPLPFDLAEEASKAGWCLRDVIIWHKDRSVPWSGSGRLRNVFEYVLQLVKGADYKYRVDRIRNPSRLEEWWVRFPERYHPFGKVPNNVWPIPIPRQGAWQPNAPARHSCPLPGELIERLILLSTDKSDVVFDPFAGIGSVPTHAERLGRRGLGLGINRSFVADYWKRVRPEVTARVTTVTDAERTEMSVELARKLATLRVLKAPRVLYESVRSDISSGSLPAPYAFAVIGRVPRELDGRDGAWADADVFVASVAGARQRIALQKALAGAAGRRPLSKFGLRISVTVLQPSDFTQAIQHKRLHHYPKGRTWKTDGRMTPDEALELGRPHEGRVRHPIPPIISNLCANEDPRPIG